MKKFKSVLILKLPYCTHPSSAQTDNNFRTKSTFRPVPSLALASLCAFIDKYKTYDYKIKAIDVNIEAYTKPSVSVDMSAYPNLLISAIKNNEYDVLCLSVMFVFNDKWVKTAVELSRRFHPDAKIVVGGGYPTIFPERCLKKYDINDVVIGEGEATFLHVLNRYNNHKDVEYENKFPFVGYGTKDKKGSTVITRKKREHYANLIDLPVPAWHYLNVEKYFERSGDKNLPIEATRGCPFCCSFCSTYLSWGFGMRYKSEENTINEILELKKRYDVESLHFVDDNLTFSKEWITKFLKNIIKLKLPFKLSASNFAVKCLDEEIIDLLVKAGFYRFGIAIESGCPEMQKKINKNLDFDNVRKIVKIIKSYKNLHLHINWMVGFPNETIEQINKTFDFARELRAHSNQFLTVLPYPGTRLFEEAKRDNLLIFGDNDLDKYDNKKCDYLKSDEWNYEQLQQKAYDANIEMNFLNNPRLDTEEGKEDILGYLEEFLKKLPKHIIANIIIGFLSREKDNQKYKKYYKTAIELLKDKNLNKTFNRYLSWDNDIIRDFNNFLNKEK